MGEVLRVGLNRNDTIVGRNGLKGAASGAPDQSDRQAFRSQAVRRQNAARYPLRAAERTWSCQMISGQNLTPLAGRWMGAASIFLSVMLVKVDDY